MKDVAQLLDGNVHPPEHYHQIAEEVNYGAIDVDNPGTKNLLDVIEEDRRL